MLAGRSHPAVRLATTCLAAVVTTLAFAQAPAPPPETPAPDPVCRAPLAAAAHRADADGPVPTPRLATAIVRRATEALEPALPARPGRPERAALDGDPDAAWLAARGRLPRDWDAAVLTPDRWAALLAPLQAPYGAAPLPTSGDLGRATLLREAGAALAHGAAHVRPLALFARRTDAPEAAAFAVVVWNWTPVARLLVAPVPHAPLPGGRADAAVLDELSTCAWTVDAWMAADRDAVLGYYLGNVGAGLELLAVGGTTVRRAVPDGQEAAALERTWPPAAGDAFASVAFTGPGPGLGQILSLLFTVDTNVALPTLPRYLAFPDR